MKFRPAMQSAPVPEQVVVKPESVDGEEAPGAPAAPIHVMGGDGRMYAPRNPYLGEKIVAGAAVHQRASSSSTPASMVTANSRRRNFAMALATAAPTAQMGVRPSSAGSQPSAPPSSANSRRRNMAAPAPAPAAPVTTMQQPVAAASPTTGNVMNASARRRSFMPLQAAPVAPTQMASSRAAVSATVAPGVNASVSSSIAKLGRKVSAQVAEVSMSSSRRRNAAGLVNAQGPSSSLAMHRMSNPMAAVVPDAEKITPSMNIAARRAAFEAHQASLSVRAAPVVVDEAAAKAKAEEDLRLALERTQRRASAAMAQTVPVEEAVVKSDDNEDDMVSRALEAEFAAIDGEVDIDLPVESEAVVEEQAAPLITDAVVTEAPPVKKPKSKKVKA